MARVRSDRGDIVLGWLTKLALVLGVLGVIGFDLISLGAGRIQTQDRAATAAREAVQTYKSNPDVQAAYEAAVQSLADGDAARDVIDPTTFTVSKDGAVTLTVQHTSATFIVDKIGPLRDWATTAATATVSRGT